MNTAHAIPERDELYYFKHSVISEFELQENVSPQLKTTLC